MKVDDKEDDDSNEGLPYWNKTHDQGFEKMPLQQFPNDDYSSQEQVQPLTMP